MYGDEFLTVVKGLPAQTLVKDFVQVEHDETGELTKIVVNPMSKLPIKIISDRSTGRPYLLEVLGILARYEALKVGEHLEIKLEENVGWTPFAGWKTKRPGGGYHQVGALDQRLIFIGRRMADRPQDGYRQESNHYALDTLLTNPCVFDMGAIDRFEVNERRMLKNLALSVDAILECEDRQAAKDLSLAARVAAGQRRADFLNARNINKNPRFDVPEELFAVIDGTQQDFFDIPQGVLFKMYLSNGRETPIKRGWNPGNVNLIRTLEQEITRGCTYKLLVAETELPDGAIAPSD